MTASAMDPTDITAVDVLAAISAGADTVFDIAAVLDVPAVSYTLRTVLKDLSDVGALDPIVDADGTRHFTIAA